MLMPIQKNPPPSSFQPLINNSVREQEQTMWLHWDVHIHKSIGTPTTPEWRKLHPSSWGLCNFRALHKRVTFTQGENTAEPHKALQAQSPLNCCCWRSLLSLFKNALINCIPVMVLSTKKHISEPVNLNTFWLAHLYQYTDFIIDYAITLLHMIFIWLYIKNCMELWV